MSPAEGFGVAGKSHMTVVKTVQRTVRVFATHPKACMLNHLLGFMRRPLSMTWIATIEIAQF
jgi:hypothetical protein